MIHNVITIVVKDGVLSISLSIWLIIILVVALVAWLFWRTKSERFMNDVEMNIELGGIGKINIKPNYEVKQIAHKAWVELKTRKAGLPIDEKNDVIGDIYESWYNLFGEIRELTRDIPASKLKNSDTKRLVSLLVDTLNNGLRPHLTRWQAKYRRWYERAVDKSEHDELTPQEIQNQYPQYKELVKDMLEINKQLVQYTDEIKKLVDA